MGDVPAATSERLARELGEQIYPLLRDNPAGLSEYKLFAALYECGDQRFDISTLRETFSLFCAHFRLFNALYCLRDKLWATQSGQLEISPLRVILRDYDPLLTDGYQLGEVDALREYYLDSTHLEQATAEELEQMLDKFWSRLNGSEKRHQALEVLGLKDPVDAVAIKQHYRRLAMEHHPDRGGDSARLQMINAAMVVLAE
ncbi:MAG: DnaJ domain-containing protein [Thiotrichaceae bacterium]|nr:DnaJ domain-containing protein [Thiotrichaceae bacterium]PCI12124.1 MAG: molecular chaperone DnaJ [Thiotrichales bacterium]